MATTIKAVDLQEIFPSTKTATINKLITENSITRLLNRLIDVDGYIISSELPIDVSNQYNYVDTDEAWVEETPLETCIRGYYFNLGTYENIINKIKASYSDIAEGDIFQMSIFIDVTNPNYPELYGQDTFSEKTVNRTEGVIVFEDGLILNSIKFYTADDTQISIEGFVPGQTSWDDIDDDVSYIKYWVRITDNTVWISKTDTSGTSDKPVSPSGSDEENLNYIRKDLTLFEAVSDDASVKLKIPMTSFHKFSSISINNIDGGEIK